MFLDIIPNDMADEVAIQLKIVLDHVFLAVIVQSFSRHCCLESSADEGLDPIACYRLPGTLITLTTVLESDTINHDFYFSSLMVPLIHLFYGKPKVIHQSINLL